MPWLVEAWRTIPGLEHGFGDRLAPNPPGVRTLRQVHGREVLVADSLTEANAEGDGIATDRPSTRVGIHTADCVPLLLVARSARTAAAIHCGWRGSAAGIVVSALELLHHRWGVAAEDLEAALGPSIGGCCYEVGPEVREAFVGRVGRDLGNVGFESRGSRLVLDLRSFLAAELRSLGVRAIEHVGPCTACSTDRLHSYRRARNTGRQLSYVGWSVAG